jgi:beta-1,4-mannosyl-glycoprotein beta-1,4-N-acetylglucosaminyltransferase
VLLSCDADEIPSVEVLSTARAAYASFNTPRYLEMNLLYYNFSWCKRFTWAFAIALNDAAIRAGVTLDAARMARPVPPGALIRNGGNHFSYFGSAAFMARKLESFSHTELNVPEFKASAHIQDCILRGADLFKREGEACVPSPPHVVASFPAGWQTLAAELALLQAEGAAETA